MNQHIQSPPLGDIGGYLLKHYTKKTAKAYIREIEIYLTNNPDHKKYTYPEIVSYIGILRTKYSNSKNDKSHFSQHQSLL